MISSWKRTTCRVLETAVADNGKIYALRHFDYNENGDDDLFLGDRPGELPCQEIAVYRIAT